MFRRIIIPLDGSEISERALKPAMHIAEQDGAEVILVRAPVIEPVLVPTVEFYGNYSLRGLDASLEQARTETRQYLDTIRQAYARPNVILRTQIIEGDPAEAILNLASEKGADLIVMSTHGYSGLKRWVLGSITERVLSGSPCPVLVIRSLEPIRRIAVTLDGSVLSEKALPATIEIAAALGASVALLRVVKEIPPEYIRQLDESERGLGLRAQDEVREEADAYLKDLAQRFARPRLEIQTAVRMGDAPDIILNFAEAHQTDLVAMATHGRTGVRRWMYGSVTDKVLRNSAGFAMLIVRP